MEHTSGYRVIELYDGGAHNDIGVFATLDHIYDAIWPRMKSDARICGYNFITPGNRVSELRRKKCARCGPFVQTFLGQASCPSCGAFCKGTP